MTTPSIPKRRLSRRSLLKGLAAAPFLAQGLKAQGTPPNYVYNRWDVNAMQHQLYQPDPHLVLIAAHRGLWRDAPENSETALRLSSANWEIIETDLVKTKDYQSINQLVVTHDPEISRTMDGMGRLYNLTLAQLQQCRLLDHYGSVYTGGVWYPSDNKGTPANDAVTGVGQRVITIDDLFRMQQDFLIGTDVKPLGPIIIMDVKGARGQELDPEFKTPGEGIMNTMNLALRTMSKLSLQQRKSMIFMVRYGLLKNNKEGLSARAYLEQYVPEYQNYDANTNPLPRLMAIFNYEDPKDDPPTSATPTNDAHFQSLLTAPYLSHFEMNEFYLGDGCQAFILPPRAITMVSLLIARMLSSRKAFGISTDLRCATLTFPLQLCGLT